MNKGAANNRLKNDGNILILHDNHFVVENGLPKFKTSTFHHLLAGFQGLAHLSSPSCDWDGKSDFLQIDGIVIRPRRGYGRAKDFYRSPLGNSIRAFFDIRRLIKEYDAIVVAGPCCTLPLAHFASWMLRKPIVGYVIGNNLNVVAGSTEYRGLGKLLAKLLAKWEWNAIVRMAKYHRTIVLGEDLHRALAPYAKNLTMGFTSLVRERDVVHSKSFTCNGFLSLLTVGRISREKGIEWALRAVSELKRRGINVHYTVVGEGPDFERLQGIARSLGLWAEVEFAGARPFAELADYYQKSDIFILPSHTEGVAKVLLEAMTARLPIVATSVGGNPWVLGNGDRGILVPYGNEGAIANAVSQLMENPEVREALLKSATKYILEHTLEASSKLIMRTVEAERRGR